MMKVFQSLKSGIQAVLGNPKVAVAVYLTNLALAMILALPMYRILHASFAHSAVRETMALGFDYDWWTEFSAHAEGLAKTFRPEVSGLGPFLENAEFLVQGRFGRFGLMVLLVGLVYLVINAFLAGGAFAAYAAERQKQTMTRMFGAAGQFFARFLSLVLMGVFCYFLVYKGAGGLVRNIVTRLSEGLATERAAFFVGGLGTLVILFLLAFVNLVFDYAKAVVVHENRQSAAEALWIATKFVVANLGKCLGLYWLVGVAGGAAVLLLFGLTSLIPQSKGGGIFAAFLLLQLLIMVKVFVRLLFYSSQLAAYRTAKAEVRRLPKA
ncbi:MAG: hypothetical protein QHJ34_00700 [bacterium]|jgi:hypothetical protein|nr:hypothetical protein [candidate division KSB1 bacterium]MDH7558737.1 hypothetical protein [bacterium]